MSATTAVGAGGIRGRRSPTRATALRLLEALSHWLFSLDSCGKIGHWGDFQTSLGELLPWLVVVVVADLLPVPIWGSVELMMSFPVLLASALVFPPYIAGTISFRRNP